MASPSETPNETTAVPVTPTADPTKHDQPTHLTLTVAAIVTGPTQDPAQQIDQLFRRTLLDRRLYLAVKAQYYENARDYAGGVDQPVHSYGIQQMKCTLNFALWSGRVARDDSGWNVLMWCRALNESEAATILEKESASYAGGKDVARTEGELGDKHNARDALGE